MWKHGAELAEGEFMNINQDNAVVTIATPHDKILIELNQKLNKTYMWFGSKKQRGVWASNQVAQDNNALQAQGVGGLSSRASVKGSRIYSNVGRDLIDSYKSNANILEEIKEEELPDELQKLPASKRAEMVQAKTAEREAIQKQIAELNKKRMKFIAEENGNSQLPMHHRRLVMPSNLRLPSRWKKPDLSSRSNSIKPWMLNQKRPAKPGGPFSFCTNHHESSVQVALVCLEHVRQEVVTPVVAT